MAVDKTPGRVCKDCRAANRPLTRPAPFQGPRCTTCWRVEKRLRSARKANRNREATYGLTEDEYIKLYEAQGRRCAVCRRATGKTKRLAVDHDHDCCPGPTSCGGCVRGLLCGPCNSMMAHARDSVEFFQRAGRYLREWPSRTAGI